MNVFRVSLLRLCVAALVGVFYAEILAASGPGIPSQEYRQRRDSLLAKMEPHSVAVFRANEPDVRSRDVNYRYRQESNFLYLTGVNESNASLLLSVDGVAL